MNLLWRSTTLSTLDHHSPLSKSHTSPPLSPYTQPQSLAHHVGDANQRRSAAVSHVVQPSPHPLAHASLSLLRPRARAPGSVIAMVGKDCVAIASDLRLGNQALLVAANFSKVRRACRVLYTRTRPGQ